MVLGEAFCRRTFEAGSACLPPAPERVGPRRMCPATDPPPSECAAGLAENVAQDDVEPRCVAPAAPSACHEAEQPLHALVVVVARLDVVPLIPRAGAPAAEAESAPRGARPRRNGNGPTCAPRTASRAPPQPDRDGGGEGCGAAVGRGLERAQSARGAVERVYLDRAGHSARRCWSCRGTLGAAARLGCRHRRPPKPRWWGVGRGGGTDGGGLSRRRGVSRSARTCIRRSVSTGSSMVNRTTASFNASPVVPCVANLRSSSACGFCASSSRKERVCRPPRSIALVRPAKHVESLFASSEAASTAHASIPLRASSSLSQAS